MECHELSTLKAANNDLRVTEEKTDIGGKFFLEYCDWLLILPEGNKFVMKLSSGRFTLPDSPIN